MPRRSRSSSTGIPRHSGSVAVTPGTRLGPYEVVSAIGAGGMGEVYRAVDTRLRREVAIKVLPDTFASDADRLAATSMFIPTESELRSRSVPRPAHRMPTRSFSHSISSKKSAESFRPHDEVTLNVSHDG